MGLPLKWLVTLTTVLRYCTACDKLLWHALLKCCVIFKNKIYTFVVKITSSLFSAGESTTAGLSTEVQTKQTSAKALSELSGHTSVKTSGTECYSDNLIKSFIVTMCYVLVVINIQQKKLTVITQCFESDCVSK